MRHARLAWRARARREWLELLEVDTGIGLPTREQWSRLQRYTLETTGDPWRSNGSTFSPDTIYGVRIGVSSASILALHYPANLHDFWYGYGAPRGHDPTSFKKAVDVRFYQLLRQAVAPLWWPLRILAEARCGTYYTAVRSPLAGVRFNWVGVDLCTWSD